MSVNYFGMLEECPLEECANYAHCQRSRMCILHEVELLKAKSHSSEKAWAEVLGELDIMSDALTRIAKAIIEHKTNRGDKADEIDKKLYSVMK